MLGEVTEAAGPLSEAATPRRVLSPCTRYLPRGQRAELAPGELGPWRTLGTHPSMALSHQRQEAVVPVRGLLPAW